MEKYTWIRLEWNNYVELFRYSGFDLKPDTEYVIETKHGIDMGKPIISPIPVNMVQMAKDTSLPKIIREATFEDIKHRDSLRRRENKSLKIAMEKISRHELSMKLINVYHFFDGSKVLFNFYSEGRVDFRNLVKDLAGIFKTRIELHQIGVRDEAQLIGGYGVCGLQYCCQTLKTNREPISIKMAKEQNLPLNAMKISGACGRLMCCLDFEFSDYQQRNKHELIQIGTLVTYNQKAYVVKQVNEEKREVILSGEEDDYQIFSLDFIKKDGECYVVEPVE